MQSIYHFVLLIMLNTTPMYNSIQMLISVVHCLQSVKRYPCRNCERSFNSTTSLRRHVRNDHGGKKRTFTCWLVAAFYTPVSSLATLTICCLLKEKTFYSLSVKCLDSTVNALFTLLQALYICIVFNGVI